MKILLPSRPLGFSPQNFLINCCCYRTSSSRSQRHRRRRGAQRRRRRGAPRESPKAVAMANRVATERTAIGLFHRSFNIIRTLSSSAPPSSSATAAAVDATDPKKPKRKKKNLFEVAQFLPNWGLGYKMAKSHWRDVSYEITKVNLYKDGRHGKAWGIRHKAGLAVADIPVKIGGVHKRGWKYIPEAMKKPIYTKKAEEPQSPVQVSVA